MFVHLPIDLTGVFKVINHIDSALHGPFSDMELQELGDWALLTIQRRTRKGVDYQGKKFTPYAPSTVADRSRRRRVVSRVTLEDTGKMMTNMTSGVEGTRAVVFFSSANEGKKAKFLNEGTRKMKRRQFMKLSKQELAHASQLAANMVRRRLK